MICYFSLFSFCCTSLCLQAVMAWGLMLHICFKEAVVWMVSRRTQIRWFRSWQSMPVPPSLMPFFNLWPFFRTILVGCLGDAWWVASVAEFCLRSHLCELVKVLRIKSCRPVSVDVKIWVFSVYSGRTILCSITVYWGLFLWACIGFFLFFRFWWTSSVEICF